MGLFLDNPEMVFWDQVEAYQMNVSAIFPREQLNFLSIQNDGSNKVLFFLEGCTLDEEIRMYLNTLWSLCEIKSPLVQSGSGII